MCVYYMCDTCVLFKVYYTCNSYTIIIIIIIIKALFIDGNRVIINDFQWAIKTIYL